MKLFVLDEVGFGTKRLRHYAYSKIGKPAVLERKKRLKYNLTCTACISFEKVEFIRFFSSKGTTTEYFADYMTALYWTMTNKYPDK